MPEPFAIGKTYPQDDSTIRILAQHGESFLLEKWVGDAFIQYIVTCWLFIDNDELHWHGNGSYFSPKISGLTHFEELCNAIEHLRTHAFGGETQ